MFQFKVVDLSNVQQQFVFKVIRDILPGDYKFRYIPVIAFKAVLVDYLIARGESDAVLHDGSLISELFNDVADTDVIVLSNSTENPFSVTEFEDFGGGSILDIEFDDSEIFEVDSNLVSTQDGMLLVENGTVNLSVLETILTALGVPKTASLSGGIKEFISENVSEVGVTALMQSESVKSIINLTDLICKCVENKADAHDSSVAKFLDSYGISDDYVISKGNDTHGFTSSIGHASNYIGAVVTDTLIADYIRFKYVETDSIGLAKYLDSKAIVADIGHSKSDKLADSTDYVQVKYLEHLASITDVSMADFSNLKAVMGVVDYLFSYLHSGASITDVVHSISNAIGVTTDIKHGVYFDSKAFVTDYLAGKSALGAILSDIHHANYVDSKGTITEITHAQTPDLYATMYTNVLEALGGVSGGSLVDMSFVAIAEQSALIVKDVLAKSTLQDGVGATIDDILTMVGGTSGGVLFEAINGKSESYSVITDILTAIGSVSEAVLDYIYHTSYFNGTDAVTVEVEHASGVGGEVDILRPVDMSYLNREVLLDSTVEAIGVAVASIDKSLKAKAGDNYSDLDAIQFFKNITTNLASVLGNDLVVKSGGELSTLMDTVALKNITENLATIGDTIEGRSDVIKAINTLIGLAKADSVLSVLDTTIDVKDSPQVADIITDTSQASSATIGDLLDSFVFKGGDNLAGIVTGYDPLGSGETSSEIVDLHLGGHSESVGDKSPSFIEVFGEEKSTILENPLTFNKFKDYKLLNSTQQEFKRLFNGNIFNNKQLLFKQDNLKKLLKHSTSQLSKEAVYNLTKSNQYLLKRDFNGKLVAENSISTKKDFNGKLLNSIDVITKKGLMAQPVKAVIEQQSVYKQEDPFELINTLDFIQEDATELIEMLWGKGLIYDYSKSLNNEKFDYLKRSKGKGIPVDYDPNSPFNKYFPYSKGELSHGYIQLNRENSELFGDGAVDYNDDMGTIDISGNTTLINGNPIEGDYSYTTTFEVTDGSGEVSIVFDFIDNRNYKEFVIRKHPEAGQSLNYDDCMSLNIIKDGVESSYGKAYAPFGFRLNIPYTVNVTYLNFKLYVSVNEVLMYLI